MIHEAHISISKGLEPQVTATHLCRPELCSSSDEKAEVRHAQPALMRVQINALISGDFAWRPLGPELVHRFHGALASSGQHLHMLQVEVVPMPLDCPRCGERALYRSKRKGFFQLSIYPLFGIYPWNCVSCRQSILLRQRYPIGAPADPHARRQAA